MTEIIWDGKYKDGKKVAPVRIDEIEDPEIGTDRLMDTYQKKGYSSLSTILTNSLTPKV